MHCHVHCCRAAPLSKRLILYDISLNLDSGNEILGTVGDHVGSTSGSPTDVGENVPSRGPLDNFLRMRAMIDNMPSRKRGPGAAPGTILAQSGVISLRSYGS